VVGEVLELGLVDGDDDEEVVGAGFGVRNVTVSALKAARVESTTSVLLVLAGLQTIASVPVVFGLAASGMVTVLAELPPTPNGLLEAAGTVTVTAGEIWALPR